MPFSLDPIHYVAAVALLFNLILGGYAFILNLKLDACEASQHVTKVLGEVQEKETKRKNKESKRTQKETNKTYEDTIAKFSSDNERLRKQITSSRILPPTPQLCTEGSTRTEINWPFIEQSIREYRQRVGNLIEKGDHCVAGLDSVKSWYDEERD